MLDQNTFMETLHLVQEIAKTATEPMDRETALSYFKDMELSAEQQEMVYQFLMLPEEETAVPDEEDVRDAEEAAASGDGNVYDAGEVASGDENVHGVGETASGDENVHDAGETAASDTKTAWHSTPHFQMYLDEVEGFKQLADSEEKELYRRLLSGDVAVIEDISHQWLKRVVAIAEEYKGRGVLLDDLVQEGNIGLLLGLNVLSKGQQSDGGRKQVAVADVPELLRGAVRESMEQYLGEECGEDQENETIIGKVALVHQAQEYLTKEKGEKPSLRELSEYTKIPVEEIKDIFSLL